MNSPPVLKSNQEEQMFNFFSFRKFICSVFPRHMEGVKVRGGASFSECRRSQRRVRVVQLFGSSVEVINSFE